MANGEKDLNKTNGTTKEGTPETPENTGKEVAEVKQKKGLGTLIKVGGSLLFVAVGTGLGWVLKGLLGGKDAEDETDAAEEESPKE